MIINRTIGVQLKKLANQFAVVAVVGPRQSGKTTLARMTFPDYAYVSLEDIDKRLAAQEDPRGFLSAYSHHKGVIFDEVQEVPGLLSYMQGIIDREYRPGFFILTGSQNFLVHEKITQTLAGRIALLTLLPLSVAELKVAGLMPSDVNSLIIKGFYPQLHTRTIDVRKWCLNYLGTYVEKDVRNLLRISDVVRFQNFLRLCAARVGNLLNYAEIARDCSISPNTAKAWISILETSFVIKLLHPYYKNFNKRITKQPKIYFYDSSLVCALLNIKTSDELFNHPLKGALFESFSISEMFKYFFNKGEQPQMYFWRDVQGHEIDCIIEQAYGKTIPIEIKASKTLSDEFFKGLVAWRRITKDVQVQSYVVYSGDESMKRKQGVVIPWYDIARMMYEIFPLP